MTLGEMPKRLPQRPRGRGTRTWEVRGVHRGPVQSDNASGPSEVVGPIGCPAGPVIQRVVVRRSGHIRRVGVCLQRGDLLSLRRGMGSFPFFGVSRPLPKKGTGPLGGLTKGVHPGMLPFSVPFSPFCERTFPRKVLSFPNLQGSRPLLRRGEGVRME